MEEAQSANPAGPLRALPPSQSQLAPLLFELGPQRLADMGIPPWAPTFVHHLVTLCKILMDPEDDRHWTDRLNEHCDSEDPADLMPWLEQVDDGWVSRNLEPLLAPGKRRFWNKFLGQATYDRLKSALADDAEAVCRALRRGLELLRPLSVALQDALSILAPAEAERAGFSEETRTSLLTTLLSADDYLEFIVEEFATRRFRFAPLPAVDTGIRDVTALITQVRSALTRESAERLAEIDAALGRKMKGANDALAHSADGASQAANSLTEVIDRLLRASIDDADVLNWVEKHYAGNVRGLTYQKPGPSNVAPTKRAQVLYYLYNGRAVTTTDPLIEAMAQAFVNARNALQKIKHADDDYDEATIEVERALRALAGALTIALRFRALTGSNLLEAEQAVLTR